MQTLVTLIFFNIRSNKQNSIEWRKSYFNESIIIIAIAKDKAANPIFAVYYFQKQIPLILVNISKRAESKKH